MATRRELLVKNYREAVNDLREAEDSDFDEITEVTQPNVVVNVNSRERSDRPPSSWHKSPAAKIIGGLVGGCATIATIAWRVWEALHK